MNYKFEPQILWIVEGLFCGLLAASFTGSILARRVHSEGAQATVANLNARVRSWWMMIGVFALSLALGTAGSLLLFAFISFFALREYVTLIPTTAADHRTLVWAFFVITPLQYWALYQRWYGLAAFMVPVYAFLFVPTRLALAHDTASFLDRAARIHWGLMICVYCISHAPALLLLELPGGRRQNTKLLMFMVIVVQASDVFQYVWGKLLGQRKIAPTISPNKTWEGFVGGVATAVLLGTGLWWLTPFSPLAALGLSMAITLLGFTGGLTMSAIKRDRGVKDFGNSIQGHGGILDRMDSVCFSAPVFFHLVRFMLIAR